MQKRLPSISCAPIFSLVVATGILAGCASSVTDTVLHPVATVKQAFGHGDAQGELASSAASLDGYKRDVAYRITQVNSGKVFTGRPQALLRSVVVLKYMVDANGGIVRSEILRSNHDRETEATALASLRRSAPLPRPASHLLRHGRVEISETWLFNNDGRFQLRTIAEPQMDS